MGKGGKWMLFVGLGFCYHVQLLRCLDLTCNSNDLIALHGFLGGLDSKLNGWRQNASSDCCSWDGVSCESFSYMGLNDSMVSGMRVVGLELGRRKLQGELSESLAGLDQLRTLNLSHNFLTGSIPSKLLHLQNLEVLDFSYNDFSGLSLRETDLPSIRFLDVSKNAFTGSLNGGICNSSTRIHVMNLSRNYFYGLIPAGFGNCISLRRLSLSSNYLFGSMPEDILSLRKLSHLHLRGNRLSGSLCNGFHNLSNLIQLDLSLNEFSGPLPDIFGSLGKLQHFAAHSNNFTGHLPASLSNSRMIKLINLRNNSLNGSIDLNCSAMVHLTTVELSSNQFHGPLPDSLSLCRELETINLARNHFRSQIPESFRNFQSLSYFSLSNCSLYNISSALRILQQCRNLTTLVLTLNFRGEEMPVDPSLQFDGLKALIIANSRLTGSIPPWLRNSTKLQLLDLSWNDLGGTIPIWLGGLTFLFYLDLSNNSFSGEIPKRLTELPSLNNSTISLEEQSTGFDFFNQITIALQYNQFWKLPPTLDLSYNLFTGPIWPEFGNLKKLYVLDLSHNSLSGIIPSELSSMKSLEFLDLSHNNLSGTIPMSLVNLNFLSEFSVAYNQLVGRVPSDGQFLTFSCSSFEGNKDLLYNICFSNDLPDLIHPELTDKTRRDKLAIIGFPFGFGGLTGFLLTVIVCFTSGWVYPTEGKKRKHRTQNRNLRILQSRRTYSK